MTDDGSSGFLPGFTDAQFDGHASSAVFHPGLRSGTTQRDLPPRDLTHCAPVPTKKASSGSTRALNSSLFGDSTRVNPARNAAALPNGQHTFGLHQGDAVEWLRSLPSSSVDLLITDPPYESLEKHRAIGTTTRLKHSKASSNDWFQIFSEQPLCGVVRRSVSRLARNSHFYLFCDPETMFVAKPIAEQCGFRFWKPLVWDKQKIGMGYHYRARYEFVLVLRKRQAQAQRLRDPGCDRVRTHSQRLPYRKTRVRERGIDSTEQRSRRTRGGSIHGFGVGRRSGLASSAPFHGLRRERKRARAVERAACCNRVEHVNRCEAIHFCGAS